MTMSVDTSRAQLEYTARDWLVNESGLTNKELKFVFTVFPQRNVLTLNDIMNLTEADLPALGFSTSKFGFGVSLSAPNLILVYVVM